MTALAGPASSVEFTQHPHSQFIKATKHHGAYYATIIIPAFNEEDALPHVLEDVFNVVDERYEVIVVDDGSHDRTREIALRFPCRVISHTVNSGKGAAMHTGIENARSEKIIFIDGDATYPASAIPTLAAALEEYHVVRGVRSLGRDNIPLLNRLGNQFFDGLISTVHRVEGADMLSGLYGLRRQQLKAMRLSAQGFDIETEIMVKARAQGLRTANIPIQYFERIGEKKLNPLRDGLRILSRVFSLALMFNPFMTYVVPGLVLWAIGIVMLVMVGLGSLPSAFASLSTPTLIVAVMAFLAGFQLVVFGCVVNLYAAEAGLSRPNYTLSRLATRSPRFGGAVAGTVLIAGGVLWCLGLVVSWALRGLESFLHTEPLVLALALVVWGIQLLSTVLFLSLFAGSHRYMAPINSEQVASTELTSRPHSSERMVGGK